MSESINESRAHIVLGQKYAYATISLILGLACFINLAGLEKALLAVIFAWLALKATPGPVLKARRVWAKTGLSLGVAMLVVVPTTTPSTSATRIATIAIGLVRRPSMTLPRAQRARGVRGPADARTPIRLRRR